MRERLIDALLDWWDDWRNHWLVHVLGIALMLGLFALLAYAVGEPGPLPADRDPDYYIGPSR